MKNGKKILLFLVFILGINTSYAAIEGAYARNDGNCNKGNIDYYNSLLEDGSIFKDKKIITKDVFQVAIQQLEKYCNNDGEGLQSPIFANQILDLAFRKVDGIKGLDYGVKLDPQSVNYRNTLNEIETEYKTNPKKISKLFKKTGGEAEQNIDPNDKTLYGKYLLACDELNAISDKLLSASSKNNKVTPMLNSSLNMPCKFLAKRRYKKEMMTMSKISLQNFYHHAQEKLYKQVNEEYTKKISRLFDKFTVLLGDFEYIVRRYIHGTDVHQG